MAMVTVKKIKAEQRREKPHLTQTGGVGRGRVFELSRDILSIGRTEDNEIVMKSESVSRCHAYLKKSKDGGWLFQDNNSKNGVRVNGKKVSEAKLKESDLLVVGDFTFRFHEAGVIDTSTQENIQLERTTPGMALPESSTNEAWPGLSEPETDYVVLIRATLVQLERHSWIAGLVAGVAIGGGLWWKASRVAARPGPPIAVLEAPAKPATLPAAAEAVSKADLAVAPKAPKKTKSDIRDLRVYLREGKDYLNEGDKESAAVAFRFALVLDPGNKEARSGLKSAGVKLESPPKTDLEAKGRAKVTELLKAAVDAFNRRSYQEAIDKAEAARKIEIKGQTSYLNEAKQIIDRARVKQKEDYQPFLESALAKLQQGDFKASAALCEEMLRTDPAYAPARECLAKSLEGIAGKKK